MGKIDAHERRKSPGTGPDLRLERLLAQLADRAHEVAGVQTRMRALLDAVVGVARELSLPVTLRKIAEAACFLVDAEFGAIGVLGPDGAERLAGQPEGTGPPEQPDATMLLGVPIVVRGEVFGTLYLGGKRGGVGFTQDDTDLVEALAAAVGFAIENARLYEQARQRQAWLAASAEITTALLSVAEPEEALNLVARRARQVTSAAVAAILVPVEPGLLTVAVAVADDGVEGGRSARDRLAGRRVRTAVGDRAGGPGRLEEAMHTGRACVVTESTPALFGDPDPGMPLGATMILPLAAAGRPLGLLVIGMRPGANAGAGLDIEMAAAFAGHAALTLELSRVQRDRERLAVFTDRDRIARDLHDVVIQRLFATGMQLQGLSRLVDGLPGERMAAAVGELDQTIADLRRTIFSLASPAGAGAGAELRGKILEIVQHAEHHLGIRPTLRIDGPVDRGVPEAIHQHLLAALREALSNIARHARATRIDVLVRVGADELLVEVGDNGCGPGGASRRSGLTNLRRRAADLGGCMEFGPGADGTGTTVTWQVPLPWPLPMVDTISGPGPIPRP